MSTTKNGCCKLCWAYPWHCLDAACPCHTTDQKQQIHNTPLKDQATTEKKCDCASCKAGHKNGHNVLKNLGPTTDTSDDIDKGLAALYRVQELIAEKQGGDTSDWRERFYSRFTPESSWWNVKYKTQTAMAVEAFIEKELERARDEGRKEAVHGVILGYGAFEAGQAAERERIIALAHGLTKEYQHHFGIGADSVVLAHNQALYTLISKIKEV